MFNTQPEMGDARGNEKVPDPNLPQYSVPEVGFRDSNVLWQSNWGVTGTYTLLPSGTVTPITDIPPVGSKIVITDIIIGANNAGTGVKIAEETSGFVLFFFIIPTSQSLVFYPRSKIKLPTAGKRVTAQSFTTNVYINIGYYYEP